MKTIGDERGQAKKEKEENKDKKGKMWEKRKTSCERS